MRRTRPLVLLMAAALVAGAVAAPAAAAPSSPVSFTILHTNDFHGQLEPSSTDPNKASNPGMARTANVVNAIRTAKGADNVLLVDAGDEMQGSLLSNLGDGTPTGKGIPTIATYNAMGYVAATFGNHEFDWGQVNLASRTVEATYPYVTANIVKNDTGNCATAGWVKPDFADKPYEIRTIGTAPNAVKVAFIGVTTTETPIITVATATAGLCFKDPADSILHYYDELKTTGQADVIVVLSHLGFNDGGYGYGIPVYGDQTLAKKLNDAGKPANLIIGGHSHTSIAPGASGTKVGQTVIAQAAYNGRRVGQADITVGADGSTSVDWKVTIWTPQNTTATPPVPASVWRTYTSASAYTESADISKDPTIDALITSYATDPDYLALVNTPVGYSAVDLPRKGGAVDNMMATFIDDAIYNYLNTDAVGANDVDIFFNNAGGIRTDWCWSGTAWTTADCAAGTHDPALLTYGHMFSILPFGNATVVGEMTGAQILEVLNYGPNVVNGVIQPAGLKYKYFAYRDTNPPGSASSPYLWAWGAFDYCVVDKTTKACEPLDLAKTYKVGTNEFLAPAGGDGYGGFKYMKNVTYWGDMLNAVNAYVAANHETPATAYKGPNGNGTLDGRITRDGDGDDTYEAGEVVPVTILHHNDSHGRLLKTVSGTSTFQGYSQLVTLIKQERAHNPSRTLLLSSGDNVQGDSMMYYFKSAGLGYASDGTPLPPELQINPLIKAFNSVGYDAWTLGNHEFNFGKEIFSTLAQADFPILQANVADTGAYGLAAVPVEPYVNKTIGPEGIKVAILGIGNHRVPSYELPSNIEGLTFSNPIQAGKDYAPTLQAGNDVVVALTHIGFTENPASVEVDNNVDTYFAAQVSGVDAIIGGHSHTNPATGFGAYKYLPTIIAGPDGVPVVVTQAYRYNTYLGEVVLGLLPDGSGGYKTVSSTGRYLSVVASGSSATPEDAGIVSLVQPYQDLINAYNNTVIGSTTVPIDTTKAFTEETNGANLQADSSVWKLESEGIAVDVHLSGAMTNSKIAASATEATPYELKVSDMFAAMPYENSLVVMEMNGPQLKAVLERAYRNYYYYKYVPGYGGYSYYTTCMLDTDAGNKITYNDLYPAAYDPKTNHVVSLEIGGKAVDFADASTFYRVSTVNYLAAGACNFSDAGNTLWPLDQIVADTQFYVRDAVIEYVDAQTAPIAPAIEGRLAFVSDTTAPVITITSPMAKTYAHTEKVTVDFSVTDVGVGVGTIVAKLDGTAVANGQVIDLLTLALGEHTFTVNAADKAGNTVSITVKFSVVASTDSLMAAVERFYEEGKIKNKGLQNSLLGKLEAVENSIAAGNDKQAMNQLNAFINEVTAQSGKGITAEAAALLILDAEWLIEDLK